MNNLENHIKDGTYSLCSSATPPRAFYFNNAFLIGLVLGKGFAVHKTTKVDWTDIEFQVSKKRFVLPSEKKDAVLHAKGGIYADEMGLGKTITMLSLVLANPLDLTRPPATDDYHFVTKATLVRDPLGAHPYLDIPLSMISILTLHALVRPPGRLKILAPNHLVKQWTDEMRKNIKPSLDVLVLTTIVQCQKVTYRCA
jgi:SNF2 family DNA or RNA helicase